jgi:hyperosmotically inducible protein
MMFRALLLLSLLGAAACAPRAGTSPAASPAKVAEAELSARVKTALLNDAVVGTRRIDVSVSGEQVKLTGRVASEAERDRALSIARAVPGVRSVTSELEIRP